jgi:hypothetical protein
MRVNSFSAEAPLAEIGSAGRELNTALDAEAFLLTPFRDRPYRA